MQFAFVGLLLLVHITAGGWYLSPWLAGLLVDADEIVKRSRKDTFMGLINRILTFII